MVWKTEICADASDYPDQVVSFNDQSLWYTKKVNDKYVWVQMTKYSRHPTVLRFLKDKSLPINIKLLCKDNTLVFDPKTMLFSDDMVLEISLLRNSWRIYNDKFTNSVIDKAKYKDILVFDTKEKLYFVHSFGEHKIRAILSPPHTIEKVAESILKATEKKVKGLYIWEFCDHIYPESLKLHGKTLRMFCGS